MSQVDLIHSGTYKITNETFTIPEGARTVDLKNTGGANGTFKTGSKLKSKTAEPVTLQAGEAYSFGDLGKPFPEIELDATGTEIEFVVNY